MTDRELLAELAEDADAWSGPQHLGDGTVAIRVNTTAWNEVVRRSKLE